MANSGNLKKRTARIVRRSREALAKATKIFVGASSKRRLTVSGSVSHDVSSARLELVEGQVHALRAGWDTLIPEILDVVSATHRNSLGADSLQSRLEALHQDVDALTLRVDRGLEALAERLGVLEGQTSVPPAKPRARVAKRVDPTKK